MPTIKDIDDTLERGYNVRAARSDYDDILSDWTGRSEACRFRLECQLDVPYGPAARQRLDIFTADPSGPTLVYLHGGYWQRGDKSAYSFLAEPFVEQGVNVVLMGYTLCPDVSVPGITDEIRAGLTWLFHNAREHDLNADRINVSGHSAGGHLSAMMVATAWDEHFEDAPPDLLKSAVPISGIYDLAPLRQTSINDAAGIDDETTQHCSPSLLQPAGDVPVLTVVGGAETDVFHEQAADLGEQWSNAGIRIEHHVEPDVDHFDVVNRLANPQSELFRKTLEWLS